MIVGMILAAGKGTRINSFGRNKTALDFSGKPIVAYGMDLFANTVDSTVIVVGAYAKSVLSAVAQYSPIVAVQKKRLGTGHAVKIGIEEIKKHGLNPDHIVVGYGDHMMFYTPQIVKNMIKLHCRKKAAVTLITVNYNKPKELAWGRIIRDKNNYVERIVEQKDADESELEITELNAGFYVFSYSFISSAVRKFKKSAVSGEYYITDAVAIARAEGKKVVPFTVDFEYVGIGVNTHDQLIKSRKLFKNRANKF